MAAVHFDTLKMVEKLEAGGFTGEQARAMTSALGEAATVAELATRADVMDLGIGMKHDFDAFEAEMKHDFEVFRAEMKSDFEIFKVEMRGGEQRMTIRLGGIVVLAVAALGTVQHFLH